MMPYPVTPVPKQSAPIPAADSLEDAVDNVPSDGSA